LTPPEKNRLLAANLDKRLYLALRTYRQRRIFTLVEAQSGPPTAPQAHYGSYLNRGRILIDHGSLIAAVFFERRNQARPNLRQRDDQERTHSANKQMTIL
jgi:hypothetical protein